MFVFLRPLGPPTSRIILKSVPGVSPGRRSSFLVRPSPLPASLAGGLAPVSRRGFRIRVVNRGIPDGYAAAFRHRQPPPDLLLLGPRCQPCGQPLGVLRVLRWSHAEPCGPTQALEVSLAFSLPGALRPPVRCPGAPRSSTSRSLRTRPQPALLTWPLFARHIDLASASPLLPQTFPCWSPLRALARSFGISPRLLSVPLLLYRSPAGSSRFLPPKNLAISKWPSRFPCLRPELTPTEAKSEAKRS